MSYMSITAAIGGIRVQRVVHPDFNSIIIKIMDHDGMNIASMLLSLTTEQTLTTCDQQSEKNMLTSLAIKARISSNALDTACLFPN